MVLRNYQTDIALNTLYNTRLKGQSGLGETLAPRITSIGGLVTVYGSEKAPVDLTIANIASKMALLKDDVAIEAFESLPNYICLIQVDGISTELVLTSINLEDTVTVIT